MAGRKPPTNPGLWTLLLDKIGLAPAPKKGAKKGKRRKPGARGTQQLGAVGDPALDALVNAPIPGPPGATGGESPFAQYGAESGLGFADALGYEAAAAAGFAPPMPGTTPAVTTEASPATTPAAAAPAAGEPTPVLPFSSDRFAGTPAATRAAATPATPASPPEPGKLFNEAALDSSLDALFSGLESGLTPPPASVVDDRPAFDEFGLGTPTPVAPAATTPVAEPAPAPVEDRPKPPPPILPDAATLPPPPPPTTQPPAPLISRPGVDPTQTSRVQPSQLPRPARLAVASGVDLKGLMAAIDRAPGVAGSMVVGYDGLIIMTSLGAEVDRDYLGAQATSLFAGNAVQLEKMKRGELLRLLLESEAGSMLMTAADMGILVVVSQDGQPMDVAAVLTTIAGALGMG